MHITPDTLPSGDHMGNPGSWGPRNSARRIYTDIVSPTRIYADLSPFANITYCSEKCVAS